MGILLYHSFKYPDIRSIAAHNAALAAGVTGAQLSPIQPSEAHDRLVRWRFDHVVNTNPILIAISNAVRNVGLLKFKEFLLSLPGYRWGGRGFVNTCGWDTIAALLLVLCLNDASFVEQFEDKCLPFLTPCLEKASYAML